MRPAQYRFGQGRRLQQVVPAIGHQAAADKGAVRQGIEKQQLAHGVAEQHRNLCADRFGGGAPNSGETLLPAQFEDTVEALRMPGHQDQQGIRMTGQQLPMRRQDHLVLALVGARGDPHRPLLCLPLPAQLGGTRQQLRIDTQVELDRTGDLDGFRTRAQLPETFGLGLGLHRDQAHLLQHRPGQPGKPGVSPGRTRRQPRIGQCHRNPAPGALMDMVGPQLGFHDHRQPGPYRIEKARRGPGQVVGQVAMLDTRLTGEQCLDPLRTGGSHAGHGDRQLRVLRQQRADHRRGGNALAHRHRVDPDTVRAHRWQATGKTLTDTPGIGRSLACPQP